MPEVRPERSGWRDLALSQRHRRWGWDCPAVDLDFLFLEYDRGLPVAIIEYKHERAPLQWPQHPTYLAIRELGTRAQVPVFGVRYADDFSWWRVSPLNALAKEWIETQAEMTERAYVAFLYQIRGRQVPEALFEDWEMAI